MTMEAIEALTAEVALADELAAGLSAAEWDEPSDCAGWRVQDVYAHMASVFHQVADPSTTPEGAGDDAEETAELMLEPRRPWTPGDVMAEYREWSVKGIDALTALQSPPMSEAVVPLGNLGKHPLHILADALVFDHYCHLRNDILRPNGPIDRPAFPSDELRLRPIMTWMLTGLPQMCANGLAVVDRPVNLVLDGPGGGTYVLRPGSASAGGADTEDVFVLIEPGSDAGAAATVTSGTHAFVCWGTKRRDWRELGVQVEGDEDYAASILDAVNVI
jgi:hypothetical protein